MAKFTGTATSYKDLSTKLADLLDGSPSLGWTLDRNDQSGDHEIIVRGDGGVSPRHNIVWGWRTFEDAGPGYFNWGVRAFTGFNDGSPAGSITFSQQPGTSPEMYLPLLNTSMNYWAYISPRRVILIVKTASSYQHLYAGFFDPFATRNEYPYPMMICTTSCAGATGQIYLPSQNAQSMSGFPSPGGRNSTTESNMYVRWVDGAWYSVCNFTNTGSNDTNQQNRVLWPMCGFSNGGPSGGPPENVLNVSNDLASGMRNAFGSTTIGGTPGEGHISRTPFSGGALTPLWPLTILFHDSLGIQIVGEVNSVYWVSGAGGLASEDVILDESVSPRQSYLAFQNNFRTDPWHFFAVRDA